MGLIFWFYGISGAGKTTLSNCSNQKLKDLGITTVLLDGDEVRKHLSPDLGFDESSRSENHRRIVEVASILASQGLTVLVATMAPTHAIRTQVAGLLGEKLRWIFIDADLVECQKRDPKKLYQRACGMGNPTEFHFESPQADEVTFTVKTTSASIEECTSKILHHILSELSNRQENSAQA